MNAKSAGVKTPKTVLVVEDDEQVRRFSLNVLRMHGYRTLEAFDGEMGLATFLRHKHEVDLVLTDIVMPVPGPEMVEKIWKVQPSAKIVFVSGTAGFSDLPIHLRTAPLLHKPFTVESLVKCVGSVLMEAPQR